MIKLESCPTPEAITRLAALEEQRATAEAHGDPLPPAVAVGYRHKEVKDALLMETHGKCAYCESKVTHVYWGDVEHILPKRHVPHRFLDYENLTFACAVCNNEKRDYYSLTEPLLNPYQDEIDPHLVALGQLIWHRNGSEVGQRSVLLLKLNRESLVERRYEQLQRVSGIADQYSRQPEGPIKRALLAQLREIGSDSGEFAFAVRTFLRVAYAIDLREEEEPDEAFAD